MAKRPTWPCYYNDLRGSTQDWTDEEFGAYVRLLIYQWDKGFIPGEESRRVKIAETSKQHWALLSEKFESLENGNLVNKRAVEIKEEIEKHAANQKRNISKRWKKDTNDIPNRYQTVYQTDTKQIPLEDEDENEIKDENKEGVTGETIPENFIKGAGVLIVPEMLAVWKKENPEYLSKPQNDFSPLREIAEMIAEAYKLKDITQINSVNQIKESFEKIVKFCSKDGLYKDFQLSQIAKYFNAITSKMRSEAAGKLSPGAANKPNIIANNHDAVKGAKNILENKYGEGEA